MHVAPDDSVSPQELVPVVMAKLVGLVPANAMLLILSVALPVLERVAACAAAVVPVVAVKLSDAGESVAIGADAAAPVPVRATVCGESDALSATESVAAKLAAAAGVKVTEMEQFAPAASELPQVLVSLKSFGFVPAMVMPLMESAVLPVLLSVTLCAALVVPVVTVKLSDAGVSVATGVAAATITVTAAEVLAASPVSPP